MSKSTTVHDLQKRCKALNLSTGGSKATLVKRLEDYAKLEAKEQGKSENESNADLECDAILLTRTDIGDPEDMKSDAKSAFAAALNQEQLEVEVVGDKFCVGNRRGLDLADLGVRFRLIEEEIVVLKEDNVALKEDNVVLKVKVASLEDRVTSLTVSLAVYKLLRNRFISTFKRDILENADEKDHRIIANGNEWAHGGDAVVDAQLYSGDLADPRRDVAAFKQLYGLHPLFVMTISK
jgi:hypothetical protein